MFDGHAKGNNDDARDDSNRIADSEKELFNETVKSPGAKTREDICDWPVLSACVQRWLYSGHFSRQKEAGT